MFMCTSIHYVPQYTVFEYLNALCLCTAMHCVCAPQRTVYVYLNALCMRTLILFSVISGALQKAGREETE